MEADDSSSCIASFKKPELRSKTLSPTIKRHLKTAAMVATHLCWEAEANLVFQADLDYMVRPYLEGRRGGGREEGRAG